MAIAKGTKVRQIVPVIEGEVKAFSVDQEHGTLQYLVGWTDEDGQYHERYFAAGEVEPV